VIIAATGLDVQLMGGMELQLDGKPVHLPSKMAYKGIMMQDIPTTAGSSVTPTRPGP